MEATSLYLVALEMFLAFCGGILFLYATLLKGGLLSRSCGFVVLLTVASSFWFILADTDGRWLGFKASLFVGCLYLASRFPRQGALLVIGVALIRFLEGMAGEVLGTKYIVLPFSLIACGLILFRRSESTNLVPLYIGIGFEVIYAFSVGARGMLVSALLVALLALSMKASRIFIKYGQWTPLAYLVFMVIAYYGLILKVDWIPVSASNFERSSMIFVAIEKFFEYPITGPRAEFDTFVGFVMDIFNYQHYDSAKGVDPHSFLLSLWRDEGALITLLWLLVWFLYWNKLKDLQFRLCETRGRIVLAMLALGVVQFSLSPPETGTRLQIALIMGVVLGFVNRRSLI